MKLGFVTAILPELNLQQVLRFAGEEDYDSVEVMCWPATGPVRKYSGVSHIDVTSFSQARADDVHELCDEHDVEISALGYYPNILSANPEEGEVAREHLKRVIDAAQTLGLGNVNTFIGNDHTKNIEHNFARFQEVWPELIRYAEERDIDIGIENCPMLFTWDEWPGGTNMASSRAIWRRMFEEIPSEHFGLNYDPSHFILLMMDEVRPIYEFQNKLFHTHAKDMRIEREILNDVGILSFGWSTPKVPGLGDIDWNRWVSALTDVGYGGHIAVEIEDEAFTHDLESRKNSLRIARNVLRPLIV